MAQSYDHIVHIRGIDAKTIETINDRDSVEYLIDNGNFQVYKPVSDVSIYVNKDVVPNAVGMMIALKNGEMVLKLNGFY